MFKRFFNWFAPALQGGNQTASSRRVFAFIVLWVYIYGAIKFHIIAQPSLYIIYALACHATFVCVLLGIVLAQTIVEIVKGTAVKKDSDES